MKILIKNSNIIISEALKQYIYITICALDAEKEREYAKLNYVYV